MTSEHLERFPSLRDVAGARLDIDELVAEMQQQREVKPDPAFAHFSAAQFSEALEFHNRVVRDGRYISLFVTDPARAAALLGTPVSDETLEILRIAREKAENGEPGFGERTIMDIIPWIAVVIVGGLVVSIAGGTTAIVSTGGPKTPPNVPIPPPDGGGDGGGGDGGDGGDDRNLSVGNSGLVFADRSGIAKL